MNFVRFGTLKANMLGKKGMIHQSLYKDFQKLLFLHLGGLFHKLTLALEKWNFVKSTSTNMFISNGHLFWVQKYQSRKAIPRNGQAMRVQISESFFLLGFLLSDFHKWVFTATLELKIQRISIGVPPPQKPHKLYNFVIF